MKIALYGIYGTYNFGCEAIVRGATKFVLDSFPDAQIVYYSYSYEYDKNRLADLNIEIVPVVLKYSFIKRVCNKLLRLFGSEQRLLYFDIDRLLYGVDIVLSIGGDIYTIPEVIRKKAKYNYYNQLVDFCEKSGKAIVVYGASVGPWGSYNKAIDYYVYHMKKYRAILCREESSLKYLKQFHFDNVMFFPDPAFQLGSGIIHNAEYLGINLSPLSLNEVFGDYRNEYIEKIARLVDKIYEKFKYPIMFLPHVLSPNSDDNDKSFMDKIKEKMKHQDMIVFGNYEGGFLEIKESIKMCRIVVAARMHCAINAIEENIPTIFLSYSQKSIGMCEYIYGNKEWCVELKNMDAELLEKISKLDQIRSETIDILMKRNIEIRNEYINKINEAKQMIIGK